MPLESRDPAVPAKFAMTVMRCLEKDPTKRYESGESLQSAFGLTAGLKISLLNPNATKRSPVALPRPTSKQPVWATFSAVLAGLTFAGWAGYAFAPPRPLDLARARELQRLRQLDWNQVTADDMPSDCLGYQPCMDRRQAINTVVH